MAFAVQLLISQHALKSLLNILNDDEEDRWEEIKKVFHKNKVFHSLDVNSPMSQVLAQMVAFTGGIDGIKRCWLRW